MIERIRNSVKLGSIDEETVLLGIIFVLSSLMLYEAQSFGSASQRLPELTSAATAILAFIVLFRNFLPSRIEEKLFPEDESDSGGVMGVDRDEEDTTETESKTGKFGIHGGLFTGVLTVVYAALGIAFGFLFVTPLFIAIYMYWFDYPWYSVIGMGLLGLIITYVFVTTFRIPLNEGIVGAMTGGAMI
ncbi:hypothetical protein CP556_22350 [Natrinema sp. CBA1119]|uniref:tripartite tricarboxylate transporter TctB family protein n=1 Tax=Natrinema sp. CBA1119 TaxID=1608465 RepID=UPI000BF8230D|nr:tripartite tricarboxylate transporter TctB family protein [Natrinema sp. CBA1119]PGF13847.1 hypothetical protein CP556_22350 [Natrinema sp. CBA1119]